MSNYVVLGVLVVCSALLSGAETALFSLQRLQIGAFAASSNPFRRLAAGLMAEPRKILVTVLLANLLANIAFYAIASNMALSLAAQDRTYAAAAVGIAAPIFVILVGDVTPKVLALGFTDIVAAATAPLLYVLRVVLWPLRVVVMGIAKPFTMLLVESRPRSVYVTPEELKMLIETSKRQGLIDREESVMMKDLVDFGKVLVREVMVPRVDMAMFQKDRPVRELMTLIRSTGHSRIPVCGRSPDDIVGIIDGRDVFLNPGRPLEEMLRKAYFVPESKTVESLLHEFRTLKRTTAIVVDEYGGTAGLVTLEDVVETIVGDIHDEHDRPAKAARMCGENCYLLSGRVPVSEWAEMFGMVVEDRRATTLGGMVLMLLGHLPKEGEQVRYGNLRFTITRVSRHSVEEIMVEYAEPPGEVQESP